jgi:hypothetical protein
MRSRRTAAAILARASVASISVSVVTERFLAALEQVEDAKRALLAAVPSPRGIPARSIAEAVLAFEEGLRSADALMAGWRDPQTEGAWTRCDAGIRLAAERAERLRLDAPALDYEGLVTVLGDLIAPLEAFEEAEGSVLRQSTSRRWPESSSGTS